MSDWFNEHAYPDYDYGSKITAVEMRRLFGEEMPVEAVALLCNVPGDWTLADLREELRRMAAARKVAMTEGDLLRQVWGSGRRQGED